MKACSIATSPSSRPCDPRSRKRFDYTPLHVDHDDALALGAVWLFDESTQVIGIAGEPDDRTGHVHGRHSHNRVDRTTMTRQARSSVHPRITGATTQYLGQSDGADDDSGLASPRGFQMGPRTRVAPRELGQPLAVENRRYGGSSVIRRVQYSSACETLVGITAVSAADDAWMPGKPPRPSGNSARHRRRPASRPDAHAALPFAERSW